GIRIIFNVPSESSFELVEKARGQTSIYSQPHAQLHCVILSDFM
ncbi:5865_t:CDS:2, partial [Scutellospora calospora]